jgi:hypothetical protein
MSSRYLGVVSLERFLAVERYRESHQPGSTHPVRDPEAGRRTDANKRPSQAGGMSARIR